MESDVGAICIARESRLADGVSASGRRVLNEPDAPLRSENCEIDDPGVKCGRRGEMLGRSLWGVMGRLSRERVAPAPARCFSADKGCRLRSAEGPAPKRIVKN